MVIKSFQLIGGIMNINFTEVLILISYLYLGILGIISPILVILLSIYSSGRTQLIIQYENEKVQSEENLKNQLKKEGNTKQANVEKIKSTIKELERIKKNAEYKLKSLDPKKQITTLIFPISISFLIALLCLHYSENLTVGYKFLWLFENNNSLIFTLITISFMFFIYSIVKLWGLLKVIIEVKSKVDENNSYQNIKIIEILSALLNLESRNFLTKVYLVFDEKKISSDKVSINLKANELNEVKIGITNSDKSTAKNVEIGIIFPQDFIIDKREGYTIYTDEKSQIVRFEQEIIHSNTTFYFTSKKLAITPLNEGKYELKTFVKGENLETSYKNLSVNIVNG